MSTQWAINRTTGPGDDPVTLAEAKAKLRLTGTTHDEELTRQLKAATELTEQATARAIITQSYTVYLDKFPEDPILLHRKPIQSVTSIKYQDEDDVQQTLASSVYIFDQHRREITLDYNQTWPNVLEQRNAIEILYVAGYGDASAVPSAIKEAVLCLTAAMFYGNSPEAEQYRSAWRWKVDFLRHTEIH